ncbi:MAG: MCE family protein [Planctomycetes bacterium]|nr:MCE family protein [Planctomycetota bacterium]
MGDPVKYFKVGIVFFVAFIILGAATVSIGHFNPFEKTFDVFIHFPEVSGLKEGDPVRVEGMEVGRVTGLKLGPQGGVDVVIRLKKNVKLTKDCTVAVSMSSLVGGRHVAIKQGKALEAVEDKDWLKGEPAAGAFDAIGEVVKENREAVRAFVQNLREISDSLNQGKGTMGRLLKDEALYEEVTAAVREAKEAVAEMKKAGALIQKVQDQLDKGEGTLAKLLMSNEVYDDLRATTTSIREILAKAERGEGTVGKMLNDERLYEEARDLVAEMKEAVASVKRITDKVENGQGPAGRLLNDEEMAEKMAETIAEVKDLATSLKNIAQKIERGEGSIGKLVNEDVLYDRAASTLESMDKTLGAVSRTKTYVTFGSNYYGETAMAAPYANLRLYPKPDRYFEIGGVMWPASKDSRWTFPEKVKDDEGKTFFKATALLGFEFMDNRLGLAGGLLEGTFGGRLSYRLTIPWIDHDVTAIAEVRGAYDDPDKLDERVGSVMIRGYLDTKIWRWFHVQAGASRIGHDAEFFAGLSFTYEDEDIKTFISLIGLAN